MTHAYTLEQAQALLPEARRRIAEAADLLAELRGPGRPPEEPTARFEATGRDVAELESGLLYAMTWFTHRAIQVKAITPALLDFPARATRDGELFDVLLCWREDEDAIAYYHTPLDGYRGREPVALLDGV